MGDLATIGVAVVGLVGGYVGGQQKAKGDLDVAREETARLHRQIEEDHFKHRMVAYHNVLMLATQIEAGEQHGYQIDPRFLQEKFYTEVDGLTVFGASAPRQFALQMKNVLQRRILGWQNEFGGLREEFESAAHEDVGPGVADAEAGT